MCFHFQNLLQMSITFCIIFFQKYNFPPPKILHFNFYLNINDIILLNTQKTAEHFFTFHSHSVAIFGRLRPIWSFQLVQVGIWSATFFGLLRPFSAISHFSKLITLKNFVLTIFQSIISKVTKIISSLFALHQSTLLILM